MKLTDSIKRIRETAELLPDDDPDKLEMINTEGDYTGLMDWAIKKRTEIMCQADMCKELSDTYAKRKQAFEGKAERMKDIISWIMDEAKETSYKSAYGTVSVRDVPPKPIVTDEASVPDEYKKTTVSIDKTKINQAVKDGLQISGVALDNGGKTLTIRVK